MEDITTEKRDQISSRPNLQLLIASAENSATDLACFKNNLPQMILQITFFTKLIRTQLRFQKTRYFSKSTKTPHLFIMLLHCL
jgi:hypothetical protein